MPDTIIPPFDEDEDTPLGDKTAIKNKQGKADTKEVPKEVREREAVNRSNVAGLLPLVPYFSGEPNTASIKDFLKSIEAAGRLGNWTKRMLLTILQQRLIGGASDYYNSNPEFELCTWEQLRDNFLHWFRKATTSEDPLQVFYQCSQRPGEAAKSFLTRLKLAGVAASSPIPSSGSSLSSRDPEYMLTRNLVNKALVPTYLKGLREESGGSIISLHNPKTIDEALALAEEFEYQRRNKQHIRFLHGIDEPVDFHPQGKNSISSQPPTVQKIYTLCQPQPDVVSGNGPTANQGPLRTQNSVNCFRCGGQGHYANVCPSPRDPNAPPTTQASSLIQNNQNQNQNTGSQKTPNFNLNSRPNRSQVSCSYCKRIGHTTNVCRLQKANFAMIHSFEENQNYSHPSQSSAQASCSNAPSHNMQSDYSQQSHSQSNNGEQNFQERSN